MKQILGFVLAFAALRLPVQGQLAAAEKQHLFIHVALGTELHGPYSGRLLVFVATGTGAKEVDSSPFQASDAYVAAKEVENWTPGMDVDVDADDVVYRDRSQPPSQATINCRRFWMSGTRTPIRGADRAIC